VITTTTTTLGWSWITSTWRTVADSIGGADTRASRRVTRESISVVAWRTSSTSVRASGSSIGNSPGRDSWRTRTASA